MTNITMRQLLQAGAHFGHQTRYWSPKMAPYIFGERNKIHIINLEKTLPMLREAADYLGRIAAQKGKILFVGTKRQAGKQLRQQAIRCGSPYVDRRWLGGMLTNYKTVKNSIDRLKQLERQFESGETARLVKKEALRLERERIKLDRTLSGIKDMGGRPDALFIIDVEQEYIAVAEARKLKIPVVAVVDTNSKPDGIDYIIPANDDSTRAIALYLEAVADSIIAARAAAAEAATAAGTTDEYVEVDDVGGIIAKTPPSAARPAEKSAAVAVKADEPAKTIEPAKASEPAAATETPPAKIPAAKPVTGEKSAAEHAIAAELAKKVVHKKPARKKVMMKKPATGEKSAPAPADHVVAAEPVKKVARKKPAKKKVMMKKPAATTKITAKKATAKKAIAKKTAAKTITAKKTTAKKTVAKKTATKKVAAKKTTVKKTTAKKTAAKKTTTKKKVGKAKK